MKQLNERLDEIQDLRRKKEKWEDQLKREKELLVKESKTLLQLDAVLQKAEKDVKKLESLSLTNLFYTFFGDKWEKLNKKKQEAIAAQLKYEEHTQTVQEIEQEIKDLEEKLRSVTHIEKEYRNILKEKEQLIQDSSTIWNEQLSELADKEAKLYADIKEYEEAIRAGDSVYRTMSQAVNSLEKAKGWATWDLVGGGMISTAIKHSHLDEAKSLVHQAQTKLRQFQNELLDIDKHFNVQFDISGFMTFADYFFDGLIVDWVVRGRISDSLTQADKTRYRIGSILDDLKKQHTKLKREFERVKHERIRLLEEAD